MKGFVSILVVLVVVLFLSASAFGAAGGGGDDGVQRTNLSSSISEPGFGFYYGTYSADGETNFSAGMTNSDRIGNVNVSVQRDSINPTHGWVYANFSGIVGDPAVKMNWMNQSTNINRHGVQYNSYVSLGSHQEIIWPIEKAAGGGEPIFGDWLSSGNASMTLSDVSPTYANMDYSEYIDEWSDTTHFNGTVRWELDFNSMDAAMAYSGIAPTSVSSQPVPEPSSFAMMMLGVIGFGLAIRFRRR